MPPKDRGISIKAMKIRRLLTTLLVGLVLGAYSPAVLGQSFSFSFGPGGAGMHAHGGPVHVRVAHPAYYYYDDDDDWDDDDWEDYYKHRYKHYKKWKKHQKKHWKKHHKHHHDYEYVDDRPHHRSHSRCAAPYHYKKSNVRHSHRQGHHAKSIVRRAHWRP